MTTIANRYAS